MNHFYNEMEKMIKLQKDAIDVNINFCKGIKNYQQNYKNQNKISSFTGFKIKR